MSEYTGTGTLVRLALRRDRVMLPLWTAVLVVTAASSALAVRGLYPTEASRISFALGANATTSLVALYGRIYEPSLGAIALIKLGGFGAALVGVLGAVTVVRHTRAEEESGRLELVGAAVVGRLAPLTAALVVTAVANLVLGLLTTAGLVAAGLPLAGSVAFGLAWAGAGLAFAGVAAVVAQLATTGRTAIAITMAVLAGAYLVRAIGDASSQVPWLSWLSPIGWSQQVRPFAGDRFGVLPLLGLLAFVGTVTAFALVTRRDLGAGLLADRAGPAAAPPRALRSPFGLAWRLHRGLLVGWLAAFALLGVILGGIAGNIGDLLDSPQAADLIRQLGGEKALTDAFLAAEMGFIGLFTAVYAVQALVRLRAEEESLHAELLLSHPVGRTRWAAGHTVIAIAGSAALLVVGGLSAGTAHAVTQHDAAQIGRVLVAALVQLPAVLVIAGITLAGFGLATRAALAGWIALVTCLLLSELGPLLKLPQLVMDVSPFTHVPRLPGTAVTVLPLVVLTAVGVALVIAGFVLLRRRDIG